MSHMHTASSEALCKRLGHVRGFDGRENEIIVCYDKNVGMSKQHIIYFGGDLQDYPENMERYNADHKMWNLETTATILLSKFQQSTVFVVKPSEMLLKTFSIYRNFLFFDEDGRPEFSSHSGALMHLASLYSNAYKKLVSELEQETTCSENTNTCDRYSSTELNIPIKLIGFSKGCVVLNQLMFELEKCQVYETVSEFLKKVTAIYWVDGGHNGRKNTYITNNTVLKQIASLNIQLLIHVTPYQVKDVNRPWIGREEKEFVEILKSLNANITEFHHFADESGCLDNHWKVLTCI